MPVTAEYCYFILVMINSLNWSLWTFLVFGFIFLLEVILSNWMSCVSVLKFLCWLVTWCYCECIYGMCCCCNYIRHTCALAEQSLPSSSIILVFWHQTRWQNSDSVTLNWSTIYRCARKSLWVFDQYLWLSLKWQNDARYTHSCYGAAVENICDPHVITSDWMTLKVTSATENLSTANMKKIQPIKLIMMMW